MANPSKDAAIFMDFERSRSWNLNRELEILKRRAECERIEEYPDTESPDFFLRLLLELSKRVSFGGEDAE